MIDFSVPEDTRLLVDTVRRFVETEVQPLEDEVEQHGNSTSRCPGDHEGQGTEARPLRDEHAGRMSVAADCLASSIAWSRRNSARPPMR